MIRRDVMNTQRADQLAIHMYAIDKSVTVAIDIVHDRGNFRLMHHIARAVGPVAKAADFLQIFGMNDAAIFDPVEKLQQLPRKIRQRRILACNSSICHAIDFRTHPNQRAE